MTFIVQISYHKSNRIRIQNRNNQISTKISIIITVFKTRIKTSSFIVDCYDKLRMYTSQYFPIFIKLLHCGPIQIEPIAKVKKFFLKTSAASKNSTSLQTIP